jgi:hypothetical protein
LAKGPGGQNHVLAVPVGVPLTIDVQSPTLAVSTGLDVGSINLTQAVSGALTPIAVQPSFQLNPSDPPKQIIYTARSKGN